MKKDVSYLPEGYHNVTPYLIVNGAAKAIEFYKQAFGAVEIMRFGKTGDKIGHAELQIGDSKIMLADEFTEMDARGPKTVGGTPVGFYLYVEDVDAVFKEAVVLGAKAVKEPEDMFYGDRIASLEDPFGHRWHLGTHIEDVTEEEVRRRAMELYTKK